MSSHSTSGLSREEEAELTWNTKKVKDVWHAGFMESQGSSSLEPSQAFTFRKPPLSFKDKLVGEIPGAYTRAFNFKKFMEDDAKSDDEVEPLRQGLAVVKFTKEFKQHIQNSWLKALIVKVYGRTIGFNFLHSRIHSMWKPVGRLNCVDLGHNFFLIRFSLKEDFEIVLRKGPWFVGEHFLSIRPWEPNFKSSSINMSSVAVWVRLYELPIEYYNAKALHQIGKTISNVLRMDTHTATEARGKFARLCVQIDIDKPFITVVKIGRFEQPVSYEGIHKLCFSCGRIGHRWENCLYIVWGENMEREEEDRSKGE